MHVRELRKILQNAYNIARAQYPSVRKRYPANDPTRFHKHLSTIWIGKLATALHEAEVKRQHSADATNIRVFSRDNDRNRDDFGCNEFLHDICIASTGSVPAALHDTQLHTIQRVYWQVESEFASDSGKAVEDFNKLVAGCAENKLFVGPFSGDTPQARHAAGKYREVLRTVLADAQGRQDQNWYLAVVPHPKLWTKHGPCHVKCWRFDSGMQDWDE